MPLRETLCVLGVALSVKFRVAVSALVVEGLNVTVTVQLPLGPFTGVPIMQVVAVMLKSPRFDPGRPMVGALVKFSARLPVLFRVTVLGALVTPCGTDPKLRGAPVNVTIGWPPKPVSETVCVLFATLLLLSVKTSTAVSLVGLEGLNVTFTVQVLGLGANPIEELFVQVVPAAIVKSFGTGLAPPALIEKLAKLRVAFPVFVRVAVNAAEVLPT